MLVKLFKTFKKAGLLWYEHDADFMAATVSYYTLFAVAPMLLLTISLTSLVYGREYVSEVMSLWGSVLGTDLVLLLTQAVSNLEGISSNFAVPILGAIFFSGMTVMAFNSLTSGLHTLWGIPHQGIRGWMKKCVQSLLCIFSIEVYFLFLLGIHKLEVWFNLGLGDTVSTVLHLALSFAATAILFSMFFLILPWERPTLIPRITGALVASGMFLVAKYLVSVYVTVTPVPGLFDAAGLILVLLIWIYVTVMIFYFGAALAFIINPKLTKNHNHLNI